MSGRIRAMDPEYRNPYPQAAFCVIFAGLAYYIHDTLFGGRMEPLLYYALAQFFPVLIALLTGYRAYTSFTVLQIQRDRVRKQQTPSGAFSSGKLATAEDLRAWGMARGPGLFLGLHDQKTGEPIIYDPFASGHSHMMTLALNRGGKTSGLVIPALLSHVGASLIVTDPKAELAATTVAHRSGTLKQRCIVIDPFGVSGVPAARLNVLDILKDDLAENNGRLIDNYLQLITTQFLPPSAQKDGKQSDTEYFKTGARSILCMGMLYLLFFEPDNLHLPGLSRIVNKSRKDLESIALILKSSQQLPALSQLYATQVIEYCDPSVFRTTVSMFDQAKQAMRIFLNEDMERNTAVSDVQLRDVLNEQTTLYLSMGVQYTEYAGPWMGLIVSMLMELLAQTRKKKKTLFLLDEAGTIGALPRLEKRLPALPGQGLRVWFMMQTDVQLKEIYGEDIAQIIMDNCSMWQGWGFRRKEITELFSYVSGMRTHKAANFTSDSDYTGFLSENISEMERPVVQATDLLHAGPDKMFVYCTSRPMIEGYLMRYYLDYHWREVAGLNPIEGAPPRSESPYYEVSKRLK